MFYLFGFQRQYFSFLYDRLWVTQWVSYKNQQLLILREYLLSPVFAAYPSRVPVVTRVCCLSFASTCCHPCLLLILREHLLSPVFAHHFIFLFCVFLLLLYLSSFWILYAQCCRLCGLSIVLLNAYFSLQYFVNPCSCFRPYPLRLMDSDYPFDIFKTFLPSPGLRTVPT